MTLDKTQIIKRHLLALNIVTIFKINRARVYLFVYLMLVNAIFSVNSYAGQASKTYSESSIKAALVYNILHFVEWDSNALTVCVYAQDKEDISSFKSLPSQTKSGNTLTIKFLHSNGHSIKQNNCHIIFISRDANADIYKVLAETKNTRRLTIGESSRFIPLGGMINFIRKDLTIKFEVNITALKQAGLEISLQVLRIADRVYTGDGDE